MTSQGSAHGRFTRGIKQRDLFGVRGCFACSADVASASDKPDAAEA